MYYNLLYYGVSLVAQLVQNLPAMQETQVWSLCREDILEKRMATTYSILAWRIPWTDEPGGLQSMRSQRVRHDWVTKHADTHTLSYSVEVHPGSHWAKKSCQWDCLPSAGSKGHTISLSFPAFKGFSPVPPNNVFCSLISSQSKGIRLWKVTHGRHACMLSHFSYVWLFVTSWTVAHQAPLAIWFSRRENWVVFAIPPPGELPNPGIEPISLYVSCIGRRVLYHYHHLGSPYFTYILIILY